MAVAFNEVNLVGRLNRLDIREGLSKAGAEFVVATFTLQINDSQIRVENFAMKLNKSGDLTGGYKAINTLFEEANALHKTIKVVNAEKAEEIINDTIVENIDECTAIKFSNFGSFKYCRLEENVYVNKEGELVRNIRITGAYPNRVDEEKVEYVPKADWEISGVVIDVPRIKADEEGNESMLVKVMFPTYQEEWQDRPASVVLNEITVESRDVESFEYIEDNFTKGSIVYLNGEIIRKVERIEMESVMEDDSRGFGRKLEKKPIYRTNIDEYYSLLGGWILEEEEIEMTPALSMDLWSKAKEDKKEKEEQMLEDNKKPIQKSFGRGEAKQPKKGGVLPF